MAYTTVNKSTDYFNTKLYTGTGSSNAISGVGFKPDLVWSKARSEARGHNWNDIVRGASKWIGSDSTSAEQTVAQGVTSFDSDGFTVGTGNDVNKNTITFASWNWKAGTNGSGTTTGSGTGKAYSYSTNTTAGFSITKYLGNGTSGHQIPHNLGVAPSMIIVKRLDNTRHWCVGHASELWTKAAFLSATDSWDSAYDYWDNTDPTSSVVQLSNSVAVNSGNENYIMYAFAQKTGYCNIGQYIGNGSSDGSFIYTGFRPAFILSKKSSGSGTNWTVWDDKRSSSGGNPTNKILHPNVNNTENTADDIDILSTGFKLRATASGMNQNLESYAYIAIGQSLVGSNNVPCTAR